MTTFAQILQEISEKPLVKNKTNPYYNTTYADLEACQAVVLPVLFKYGWFLRSHTIIETFGDEAYVILETEVVDDEGVVQDRSRYPVAPLSEKPQTIGSGLTYARRYNLQDIFLLTAEDDDDGNIASGIEPMPAPPKPRPGIRRLS